MSTSPSISFVCCVEAGPLEVLTVRLIESLRRWGGAFADAPVFAVTPRFGPKLSARTLKAFSHLNVRYLLRPGKTTYSWFQFYNKPLSVAAVEALADTETICWLDSDMLVVGEPEALTLRREIDFTACASEKEMGSSGAGDPFEPIWRAACDTLEIDIEKLPWLTSEPDDVRIRLYWNGGIFAYRRSTDFGQNYLDACTQLMNAGNILAIPEFSIGFNEMSAIGLAMHRTKLNWQPLPYSHNHSINRRSYPRLYNEDEFRGARIIHYHDSMHPAFWDTFLRCLRATHPPVADWLAELGPLRNETSYASRLWGRGLRNLRARQERKYLSACRTL
jgi:hypothetical protein